MRYLKAFALGAAAAVVLATAALLALSAVASTAGSADVDIALGPVRIARVLHVRDTTETSMGPGLLLLVVACGCANAAALELLRRRGTARGAAGAALPGEDVN